MVGCVSEYIFFNFGKKKAKKAKESKEEKRIYVENPTGYDDIQKQLPEVFCKKKVFLKISQISQENSCVGVFF